MLLLLSPDVSAWTEFTSPMVFLMVPLRYAPSDSWFPCALIPSSLPPRSLCWTELPLCSFSPLALSDTLDRRKINNKLSAQDSRRRRKEYVGTLENHNEDLQSKIDLLEQEKRQLSSQLKSLHEAMRPQKPAAVSCTSKYVPLFRN